MDRRHITELEYDLLIESVIYRSFYPQKVNVSNSHEVLCLGDERTIRRGAIALKQEFLTYVSSISLSSKDIDSGRMQNALKNEYSVAIDSFARRSGNNVGIPPSVLCTFALKAIIAIDYIIDNATQLSKEWNDQSIYYRDLSVAVFDIVLYALHWNKDDAIPLLTTLLDAGYFGRMSGYKCQNFIRKLKSSRYDSQPLCTPPKKRNLPGSGILSWIKYAESIRRSKKKCFDPSSLRRDALDASKARHPQTVAIISSLFSYVRPSSRLDKIWLNSEPTLVDFAQASRHEVSFGSVCYSLALAIDGVKRCPIPDIHLTRGILRFMYPSSSRQKLEDIILHSVIGEELQKASRREIGASKTSLSPAYTKGISALFGYFPIDITEDARFCNTMTFFTSLTRSHSKKIDCPPDLQ